MNHPKVIDVLGTVIEDGAIVAANAASGAARRMNICRVHRISKTGKTIELERIYTEMLVARDVAPHIDPRPTFKAGTGLIRVYAGGMRIGDDWHAAYDTLMVLETGDKTRDKIMWLIEKFEEAQE